MPLAVANSVGELAARHCAERLSVSKGEESVAPSHSHLHSHPAIQSDRGVFLFLVGFSPAPGAPYFAASNSKSNCCAASAFSVARN